MPEITATELRRLEAFSNRIVRVEDRQAQLRAQRDAARAEVKALKATVRELERTNRELAKTTHTMEDDATDQQQQFIDENQRLASELEVAGKTAKQVTTQATRLAELRDALKGEMVDLKATAKTLNKDLTNLTKSNTLLTSQLRTATAQLEATDVPVFIPPDKIGGLLDDFVSKIDIGGLEVAEGDIRLHVAFGGAGDAAGFVIPSTAADKDLPLHTINLNLVKKAPTLDG